MKFNRRVKPPPFKRDSIDMDKHGRVWKYVKVDSLAKGDVVRDRGLVSVVAYHDGVHVGFVNGEFVEYGWGNEVFAFVKRDDER